jgi:PBP1b-binding outer membrane lipoprotein LpoB
MKYISGIITIAVLVSGCSQPAPENAVQTEQASVVSGWQVDFLDEFDTFNPENWQDQMLWVNNEDQCYVPDNQFNTREVSDGTLKIRVTTLTNKVNHITILDMLPVVLLQKTLKSLSKVNGPLG